MHHLNENIKTEIARLKHSKRTIMIGFVFFGVISAAVVILLFLKVVEEREVNQRNEKLIEQLKYENVNMQKSNNNTREQISNLINQNERLSREINQINMLRNQERQLLLQRNNSYKPQINNQYSNITKKEEPVYENQTIQKNETHQRANTTQKYQAPRVMYPNYTNAKLVSDSEIKRMPDNRFKSTMPIYGRYINEIAAGAICGKNEIIYRIENECHAYIFPLEKIFFKKRA